MQKSGSWWMSSKKDPRWNASGHSNSVGGFVKPREVTRELELKEEQLGEPPDDLEWGYMKD